MRLLFFFCIFIHVTFFAIAQKKVLNYDASKGWPKLQLQLISNNGRFIAYSISSKNGENAEIVQATDGPWKMEFPVCKDIAFTSDSRLLIFINDNDSLGMLDLEKVEVRYFSQVSSFKLPTAGNCNWLGCLFKEPLGEFICLNLITGQERKYLNINDFSFENSGKVLVLQESDANDSVKRQSTVLINLMSGKLSTIDHNLEARDFLFDDRASQLAFLAKEPFPGQNTWVLKYYRFGMDSAVVIISRFTEGMNGGTIRGDISFNKEGDKIFFRISDMGTTKLDSVDVVIRNYKDEIFPEAGTGLPWAFTCINDASKVHRLDLNTDFVNYRLWIDQNGNGDYALVEGIPTGRVNPYKPNDQLRRNLYLVSTKSGCRKLINANCIIRAWFSLTGKYVIWYDREKNQWITYRVSDGLKRNITKEIPTKLFYERDNANELSYGEGIAGWLENDSAVLIYDRYDIWQVDPDGIKAPINITSGWGRKNDVRLRYMDFIDRPFEDFNTKHLEPLRPGDTMTLSAFNIFNKDNGFFSLVLGKDHTLRELTMGNDAYYFPFLGDSPDIDGIFNTKFPVKAKHANAYIVQRMNDNKYPNLFFTINFKDFRQLTGLEPQKNYYWYHTQLIHFRLPNGMHSAGILYKPENFNPRKKYPLIFYYYERNSDALHEYIFPELSDGLLNIPWFVSNGYLVFVPDIIYYKLGYPGDCAYQSVNASANLLCRMLWVNANRMGLQGHSFGGWETNYIVTHTNRFAAAAPSSGFCDAVALNSQFSGVRAGYFEAYQGRLAVSFWKNPQLYVRNSPIYNVDKVTTPLLILNNKNDQQVPFIQGEEWYNGLAHLQKKAWLLSYPDEQHTIDNERNQLDYSIRLSQFFDHFLKGTHPPKWLTADMHSLQGRNNSLELDSTGAEP